MDFGLSMMKNPTRANQVGDAAGMMGGSMGALGVATNGFQNPYEEPF